MSAAPTIVRQKSHKRQRRDDELAAPQEKRDEADEDEDVAPWKVPDAPTQRDRGHGKKRVLAGPFAGGTAPKDDKALLGYFIGEQKKRDAQLARRRTTRFDGLLRSDIATNIPRCVLQREISSGLPRLPGVYNAEIRRFALARMQMLPVTLVQQKRVEINGRIHSSPERPGRINVLQFHPNGDLLASAASDGGVSIHSMRRILSGASVRGNQVRRMVSSVRQRKREVALKRAKFRQQTSGEVEVVQEDESREDYFYDLGKVRSKTQSVWKRIEGHSVLQALAWDPTRSSKIAVGGRLSSTVSYFDVVRADGMTKQLSSRSCSSISSLDFGFDGTLLMAGSNSGNLLAWDRRVKSSDIWHLQLLEDARKRSVHGSSVVTGVCRAQDGRHVVASTLNGYMFVYDLRMMRKRTFSARKEPACLHQWTFPYKGELAYTRLTPQTRGLQAMDGVVTMHHGPDPERLEMIIQQQTGTIRIFDPIQGTTRERVECSRRTESEMMSDGRFLHSTVEDITRTFFTAQSARRNCLASLKFENANVICAGFPGIPAVQLFDLGSAAAPDPTVRWESPNKGSSRRCNLTLPHAPVALAASPTCNAIAAADEVDNAVRIYK
ncbi:Diphthine methyltransferase [Hondaea fermentalgiana]|uniref:Diphthine methyltransferase n=1 Tax=Hondaea fermentalgiana TaxID=2315210 RepID=A0A2R5GP34_9STRA|nr:Diphthine methyltransferase [Hondaea fermentalgiana]|eukprot:GBG32637.1 Diphthine methyltransferase [Hondaea fermentalgiana]